MVNCSICLEVIRTPTCCIPCGHVFCNMCIRQWQRPNANTDSTRDCPQCRRQIKSSQIIRFDTSEEVNDTESLKRKWESLSEDWKHVLAISMAVLVVLLLVLLLVLLPVDVQHDGLIQSVVFPVFYTFFAIFHELLYIVVRLLYYLLLCTKYIIVDTLISVAQMIIALCLLSLAMAMGFICVVTMIMLK